MRGHVKHVDKFGGPGRSADESRPHHAYGPANAEADAKAHGDTLALMCYQYLAGQLPSATTASGTAISGPISGFQHLRDLGRALDQGISQDFQLNCAPLLSDARANLLKLGVLGAGAAGASALP